MNVLIDAHMVGENESGNERYAFNLVRSLAALHLEARFVVAASHPDLFHDLLNDAPNWTIARVSPSPLRRLFFELPRLAAREKASVTHVTYAAPPCMKSGVITTIHDVSYLPYPEWFSPRDRLVLRAGIGFTLARGASILTLSQHSYGEIKTRYGLPPDRICIAPLAADPVFTLNSKTINPTETLQRLGIVPPFVLAVGNLQPRKNLVRLISAFAFARKSRSLPHNLVIAGKAQWRESEVVVAVEEADLSRHVVFPGFVTDHDLVALYHAADCFVYPSLYEGFGLPVLEAMACGTPVITSNTTSLPEVAGDAAILVDPADMMALAQAMQDVLTDTSLRKLLRQKGVARAALFSWENTAHKTWEAYRRTAARL